MTKYEKQIYDIVNVSRKHMTAEQVYEELQKIYPAVARATVYNNLNKLCDVKLIRRVSLEDSPDRYDRIEKHDHLVCQKCGRLSDVCFDDLTSALQKQFGDDFLFLRSENILYLSGVPESVALRTVYLVCCNDTLIKNKRRPQMEV